MGGRSQAEISRELVAWLSAPEHHVDSPDRVELVETHASWVFLTRRYAYKLKKPVTFDFLDFSTVEARRAACEQELLLNRRLARDVYLAVVPITRDAHEEFQFGGEGAAVDWLVKMRRLPAERRLDCLWEAGQVTSEDMRQVSQTLTRFYQTRPPLTLRPEEYLRALEQHIADNRESLLAHVAPADQSLVRQAHTAQLKLLRLAPELLAERVVEGRLVDGHGDLRPEHIYLTPEPIIVDCIEFNDEFRRLDVADELCFLAMELRALSAEALGERILRETLAALNNKPDARLLRFYQNYRACVRAKVAALRGRQLSGSPRDEVLLATRRYLELAVACSAADAQPLLLQVGGLMGTGKSTLARALAEQLGAVRLASDEIRQQKLGGQAVRAGFDEGPYTAQRRGEVYDEMFRQAAACLERGESVVLDATFSSAAQRARAEQLAATKDVKFLPLRCECPLKVAEQRIARRLQAGNDASEARPELAAAQHAADEPPPEEVLRIDTTQALAVQRDQVYRRLREVVWNE